MKIRKAEEKDALVCAQLANYAGEGMGEYLWMKAIEADPSLPRDPWEVGAAYLQGMIAAGEIDVIEIDGAVAAGLTGHAIPAAPEPVPADTPPILVNVLELEAMAPSTWLVNVLAALPEHRGKGLGSRLLRLAEEKAHALGLKATSLVVADQNSGAYRLYKRTGYKEVARRPIVKGDWDCRSTEWVLMVKDLD